MVKYLKNHPGMWLRDDAADAINAMEDEYGPIIINSAGRTVQQQQDLIDAYDRGEPNIYNPFRPAENGPHVRDGGIAVDVYNYTDDRDKLNKYGFVWYGPNDPVHYTFTGWSGGGADSGDSGWNPFGIAYCAGLQKIANLYGAGTEIDQKFGPKSMAGFASFLRANYGYTDSDNELGPNMWASIARWLRARWDYEGNDVPGPVMRAALQRAETANYNELD